MEKRGKGERPGKENLRSDVGRAGEDLACAHLERAGFDITCRNWTAWAAEIDVVALDREGRLWFFEVKFRRSANS
ncbi:MAG: YraN family protein [Patescibacteria group bacterium]